MSDLMCIFFIETELVCELYLREATTVEVKNIYSKSS